MIALLGGLELAGGVADAAGRDVDEQLVHRGARRAVPDELVHDAEPAADRDRAAVRRLVAADDAQQRRLARAVGADQGRRGALADAERHLVEQGPAVGQPERDAGDVDVGHCRS